MKRRMSHECPAVCGRSFDRINDRRGDRSAAFIRASPACVTPARVDLDQLDAAGGERPVARDAAEMAVDGRSNWGSFEITDDIASEDERANVERRMPDPLAG